MPRTRRPTVHGRSPLGMVCYIDIPSQPVPTIIIPDVREALHNVSNIPSPFRPAKNQSAKPLPPLKAVMPPMKPKRAILTTEDSIFNAEHPDSRPVNKREAVRSTLKNLTDDELIHLDLSAIGIPECTPRTVMANDRRAEIRAWLSTLPDADLINYQPRSPQAEDTLVSCSALATVRTIEAPLDFPQASPVSVIKSSDAFERRIRETMESGNLSRACAMEHLLKIAKADFERRCAQGQPSWKGLL